MSETELTSKQPEVWVDRGNVLLLKGNYQEAVRAYDRALLLNADCGAAKTNKIIAAAASKRVKSAPAHAERTAATGGGLFAKFAKWMKG